MGFSCPAVMTEMGLSASASGVLVLFIPTVPAPRSLALQSVGKCSFTSPGAVSVPEQEQGRILWCTPAGTDIHLVGEGKGQVSRPSWGRWAGSRCPRAVESPLCTGLHRYCVEWRSTCGSSTCASEGDLAPLGERVTNALWLLCLSLSRRNPGSGPAPALYSSLGHWVRLSLWKGGAGRFFNEGFFSLSWLISEGVNAFNWCSSSCLICLRFLLL